MIPITRTADGGDGPGVESVPEPLREAIGKYGRNGTLSMAAGTVSVVRGLQVLRRNRVRGLSKLLFGAGWIAIGLVQRQHSTDQGREDRSEGLDETFGDEMDADDITPGETDDDMAATNTVPPSDVGEPEGHDVDGSSKVGTAAEPAEMTGPTAGDAAPADDKTTVPDEPPSEDVSMAGQGDVEEGEEISGDDDVDGGFDAGEDDAVADEDEDVTRGLDAIGDEVIEDDADEEDEE